ncbi:MAG: DUF4233 domain-containing protein [Actinomycetota bacterium]
MRVLGSTVLVLEAIVVFLAALVAAGTGAVDGMGRSLLIGGLLALALIAGVGTLGRPFGVTVGWVLQGFVLWVPSMWIVGGIFVVLWFFAVRNGSRIDALRAERAAESDGTGGDN